MITLFGIYIGHKEIEDVTPSISIHERYFGVAYLNDFVLSSS